MYGIPITLTLNHFEESIFKVTELGIERPTTTELQAAVQLLTREIEERQNAVALDQVRNGGTALDH